MKKMNQILNSLLTISLLLFTMACSDQGGFNTNRGDLSSIIDGSNDGQGGGDQGGGQQPQRPPPAKPAVDLNGFIDGGQYAEKQSFSFDKERNQFVISMPLGIDGSLVLINGTIPSLPDVEFYVNRAQDGTAHLVLRVPIKYFVRGVNSIPADRLPNGAPLPMPSGELPAAAFEITPGGKKAYLYIGVEAIGVYVESDFITCMGLPICIDMQFPIKNRTKTKVLGYFSLLMPRNGGKGGFFISSILPPDIARILDEHFIP